MAFFSKEQKKEIAPKIKAVCNKFGMKATLSIVDYSEVVLKIRSGEIDFEKNCKENEKKQLEENEKKGVWINNKLECFDHRDMHESNYKKMFSGIAKEFLIEIYNILFEGNHNRSDSMTDYFDVGWYVDVKIGTNEKPYILTN